MDDKRIARYIDKWGELENNEVSECLKVANGLRNRLVLYYSGLDDNIAWNLLET